MLYAVQGVLQYISYQNLDSVTFNGLTQTKTLSAALWCWLIMGTRQSPKQILALSILFGSALVFQGYIMPGKEQPKNTTSKSSESFTNGNTTVDGLERTRKSVSTAIRNTNGEDWVWRGVFPCLAAAFLSGLAGALSQKGLQLTGARGRDPFLYTIEISSFSAVALLVNIMRSSKRFSEVDLQKQWVWNWKTLIPIIVKATGGVITALLHKYAGSVSKGFALMLGLVLSNMIQLTLKQDSLKLYQVWGTMMIMISTWLFFTN
jgi:solute carrier family 35 (UDP-sugar transporter), member A1/2/3